MKLHVRYQPCLRSHVEFHVRSFARRTPRVNVKLHLRTWNSTGNVKLQKSFTFGSHVELHVRTSTNDIDVNHVYCLLRACAREVSRSHVELHVWTSSSTYVRETPRGNVEFHRFTFARRVRTWNSTCARWHGWCAHVEFHVRTWSLKELAGWPLRGYGSP